MNIDRILILGLSKKMSQLPAIICEKFHTHLGLELDAFYFYWAASTNFKGLSSSYPGFAKYFQSESNEEQGHAQKIIDFLIKRGCLVQFPVINPVNISSKNPLGVLTTSLEKERTVLQSLENLHRLSADDVDPCDFLEDMISEQQSAIADLIRKISEIETLVADGQIKMGFYLYDQKLAN